MTQKKLAKIFHIFSRISKGFGESAGKRMYIRNIRSGLKWSGDNLRIGGKISIIYPWGIIIGNNVSIGPNALLDCRGGIIIGNDCHFRRNLIILSTCPNDESKLKSVDHKIIPGNIIIGEGVWIGMNVCITPGVRIGKGAIIGNGCVISKNVEPGQIIQSKPKGFIDMWDTFLHDKMLLCRRRLIIKIKSTRVKNHNSDIFLTEKICFIVSTGRTGSHSISQLSNQHKDIIASHELLHTQLKVISTNYLAGMVNKENVKRELIELYGCLPLYPINKLYLESDQKLVPLIEIIAEIFPNAKFIWLIRSPKAFLRSAKVRGWYINDEPVFKKKTVLIDPTLFSDGCRITAINVNQMSQIEWNGLNQDDRIIWYWNYWNQLIQNFFKKHPVEKAFCIKLEAMNKDYNKIFKFLKVDSNVKVLVEKTNSVKEYHKHQYDRVRFHCELYDLDSIEKDYKKKNQMDLQFNYVI